MTKALFVFFFVMITHFGPPAVAQVFTMPPMTDFEKRDLERVMNSSLYKKYSDYFESLVRVYGFKKPRYKESELAFAWNEKVYKFNQCYQINSLSGPGRLNSCLQEYFPTLANENSAHLTALDRESLLNLVMKHFGSRLNNIEKDLPGFKGWVFSGFSKKWALQKNPITEAHCQNQTLYKVKTQTMACFADDLVRIDQTWFDRQGSDSLEVAEMVLHELFRIKISGAAKNEDLPRQKQDNLVASLTMATLNPQVPAQKIYDELLSGLILLNGVTAEELRLVQLSLLADQRLGLLVRAAKIAQGECLWPRFKVQTFKDLIGQALELVSECKRYLEPTDMPIICETDTVVLRMHSYVTNCPFVREAIPDVP